MRSNIEPPELAAFYRLLHLAGSLCIQQLTKEQISKAKQLLEQGYIQRLHSELLPSATSQSILEAQQALKHSPQLREELDALIQRLASIPPDAGSIQLRQIARLQLILKQPKAFLESFELYGRAQDLGFNPDRDHSRLWQHILGAKLQGNELIPAGEACLEVAQIQQQQGILSQSLSLIHRLKSCPISPARQHMLAHLAMRRGAIQELEQLREQSAHSPLLHAYIDMIKGNHAQAHQHFIKSLGNTQHEIYRIQSEGLQAAYPWAILNAILLERAPRLIGYWIDQLEEQILPLDSPFQHEQAQRADIQVISLLRRLQAHQIESDAYKPHQEQSPQQAQKQESAYSALSPLAHLIHILLAPHDTSSDQSLIFLRQAEDQEDYHYAQHLARFSLSAKEQRDRAHFLPYIAPLALSRAQQIKEKPELSEKPEKSAKETSYSIYWDIQLDSKSQIIKQLDAHLLPENAESQQRGRSISLEKLKRGYYAEHCQQDDYALLAHIHRKPNSPTLQWQVQASGIASLATQPRLRLLNADGSLSALRLYAIPETRAEAATRLGSKTSAQHKARDDSEEMPRLKLQSDGSYHINIPRGQLPSVPLPPQPLDAEIPQHIREKSSKKTSTSGPAISLMHRDERLQIIWGIQEQGKPNELFFPANSSPVNAKQAKEIHQLIKKNQALLSSGEQQDSYSWSWLGLPQILHILHKLQELAIPLVWHHCKPLSIQVIPTKGLEITDSSSGESQHEKRQKSSSKQSHWLEIGAHIRVDAKKLYQIEELLRINRLKISYKEQHYLPLGEDKYLLINSQQSQQLESLTIASQPIKGRQASQKRKIHPAALPHFAEQWPESEREQLPLSIREALAQSQQHQAEAIAPPPHIHAILRPYQQEGYEWLVCKAKQQIGVILADDMGLGKTIQSLSLLAHQSPLGASLIIAPFTLIENWRQEAQRFFPQLRMRIHKNAGKKIPQLIAGDIYLASYGQISSQALLFAQQAWNEIILDEAHAIKNPLSKRSTAIFKLHARHRIALTGTPVENRILELWSIMEFLNAGHLGKKSTLLAMSKQKDQLQAIREHIAPLILRRHRHDVLLELPPLTEICIPIELNEEERALYESTRRRALRDSKNEDATYIHSLAALSQLRIICNNAAQILPSIRKSSKLEALNKLCKELHAKGHRALIFSNSTKILQAARRRIEKSLPKSSLYFDGKSSSAERHARIESFQKDQQHPFFFISLQAGGSGINLTAADYVILLDPWWNPASEAQAAARAHRMGQQKPVTLCRLICHDSIEEHILRLQQEKRELSAELEQITQEELQHILQHRSSRDTKGSK